ncbi:MAG TPA: carbamoyltransferase C-terminal domain-containing protein [Candidatus Binataceae bacterium]|nr:carbamoyltransferase C-terminal domain-containing protein [Candidatus Binataceae bacterium]
MNVLGLNLFHGDASAAILVDGRPVMAVAEERLNRVKHYAGFPRLAIEACLKAAGIRIEELEHVAIGRGVRANLGHKLAYAASNPGKLVNLMAIRRRRASLDDLHALFSREFEVAPERLRFRVHRVEHHLAHIASAYLASDFDSAAGLSYDGAGDFVSTMMARCEGNEIHVLKRLYLPHSLGIFYGVICRFIGFGEYGDEGKVMGLAPFGRDQYHDLFERLLKVDQPGDYAMDFEYFNRVGADQGFQIGEDGRIKLTANYSDGLLRALGPPRPAAAPVGQREKDIAFGLQSRFETAAIALANQLARLVPEKRLAMAGGCALNSSVNGKLFGATAFERMYVQPAAGDEGLALGAALYAHHRLQPNAQRFHLASAALGPSFDEGEIRAALDARGLRFVRLDQRALIERSAEAIEQGEVVGWFQGAMEWGPRALGARSILAHPGLPEMREILNRRVKHREAFRPFAPAVKAECQAEYFERSEPSPFMLHVYPVRSKQRHKLSAITHVDGTGRVQSVTQHDSPLFYDLIDAFERRTGVPVVLNTSFNDNEPIVCRPEEALECFMRTRIDSLAIGPFFVARRDNGLAQDAD